MAKIMTRVNRMRRRVSAAAAAGGGSSAKARKITTGATARAGTLPAVSAGEAGAGPYSMSAALGREQAGRPDIEHDRHQQIDQHRGDGRTDRASRRGRHDQAQDV